MVIWPNIFENVKNVKKNELNKEKKRTFKTRLYL